jgi:para-aminobenzoate synthetase / 4-amino-4-deoxychorismate lyase
MCCRPKPLSRGENMPPPAGEMAARQSRGKSCAMFDATAPFIFFDDARAAGRPARLYSRPAAIIETADPAAIRSCLSEVEAAQKRGLHAAGFLSYEAGHALEPKLAPLGKAPEEGMPPLLWFGLFESCKELPVARLLPDPEGGWTSAVRPLIGRYAYEASVEQVKAHIFAGDIYQANLTFEAEVRTAGHPLAIYAGIRRSAAAGHGAVLFTGKHWLLSFSPELFFSVDGSRVTTRPMKGTASRRADSAEDAAVAIGLRDDPKQRAENLMIVDLLRNDLSKVSRPGSVKVPALFEVERYPTVHQMTSTVIGELENGVGPVRLLEAIFPCGSITGAPKIRAMEIIADVEQAPRGIYTGSIGWISPDGKAEFNVAIRTLVMAEGADRAAIGLGSGIVADSIAGDEWQECLAKGRFVSVGNGGLDLIEAMRFDPETGIEELPRHLARIGRSAEQFGFAFDRHHARNELQAATFRLREPAKVRMLLSPSGALSVECRPLPAPPSEAVGVAIARCPVASGDFRLRHKTSDRRFYEEVRNAASTFEVLLEDEEGFLTEGSFTSLFVERDGLLLTPPLARGLLPGILREKLIEEGKAIEADLRREDLEGGFYIGNAVRGLIRAWTR